MKVTRRTCNKKVEVVADATGVLERFAAQPHAPGALPVKLKVRLDQAKARTGH